MGDEGEERRGVELWERKADVSGGGRGGEMGFRGKETSRVGWGNEQGRMGGGGGHGRAKG